MKFGVEQTNSPEPKWMKLLFNLVVIVIMPAFAIYIISIPDEILDATTKNFIGATTTFFVAIFQGIKELSGDANISISREERVQRIVNVTLVIISVILLIALILK